MHIRLNDDPREVPSGCTLAQLLALEVSPLPSAFSSAVNAAFVPKNAYASTVLQEGDSVQIFVPIVGG